MAWADILVVLFRSWSGLLIANWWLVPGCLFFVYFPRVWEKVHKFLRGGK